MVCFLTKVFPWNLVKSRMGGGIRDDGWQVLSGLCDMPFRHVYLRSVTHVCSEDACYLATVLDSWR